MTIKIAIDAGHGLYTAGKRCPVYLDTNQTREWQLNDRICDILESRLAEYNCTVLRVDDTYGQKDISLQQRVKAANGFKADVYISVHHNAGIAGGSGGGTVVYYAYNNTTRREQANALYNCVTKETGLVGNRASKVVYKKFYVIAKTSCPAFLLENGFMDSSTDCPIILSSDHAKRTADGIFRWLIDVWNLKRKV